MNGLVSATGKLLGEKNAYIARVDGEAAKLRTELEQTQNKVDELLKTRRTARGTRTSKNGKLAGS